MKGISELFGRIRNRYIKEAYERSVVKEAVSSYAKVDLPLEDISFKAGAIVLKNLDQMSKSSVFIKKRSILGGLKEKNLSVAIDDIMFS
jgi:hypothetical protein